MYFAFLLFLLSQRGTMGIMFGVVTFLSHGWMSIILHYLFFYDFWVGWPGLVLSFGRFVWVWAYHIMDGLGLGLKDCIP